MEKIDWKNLPSTDTPIDSDNLNLMQKNIENAIDEVAYGTTLYENPTGTVGAITLSESCANFNKIKIFGYGIHADNPKTYFTREIEKPNQKNFGIDFYTYNGNGFTYNLNEVINLNGNVLKRGTQWELKIGTGDTTRIEGEVYITKVVGYK